MSDSEDNRDYEEAPEVEDNEDDVEGQLSEDVSPLWYNEGWNGLDEII